MNKLKLIILVLLIFVPISSAQNDYFLVVNSGSWEDVYLGTMYANFKGYESRFLISERHSSWVPNYISKDKKILMIESAKIPFVLNYAEVLKKNGYDISRHTSTDITETNLYLAEKLVKDLDVNKFIILDNSYGYNAISVAPYAQLTKSYVLFADNANIRLIKDFLDDAEPEKILLYGQLDEEVLEELKKFHSERIDSGDRFSDNIEIVKKFRAISDTKQVLFTNGNFIEAELMSGGQGNEPALFVGLDKVPEQVMDYLKSGDIKIGVVIGNELTKTAKEIKDKAEISVFIKFAQSIAGGGEFQEVQGLDRFLLPSFDTKIKIEKITYNTLTKQLEVVYTNEKDMKTYLKSDIGILADKRRVHAVGDPKPVLLQKQETRGGGYEVDLTDQIREGVELEASFFTRYGESEKSMDKALEGVVSINLVEEEDVCKARVNKVSYDKQIQRFIVEVENLVEETCYVKPGLTSIIVNDDKISLEYEDLGELKPKEINSFKIKQRLDDVDIEDNNIVKANVIFGSRKDFLLSSYQDEFELEVINAGSIVSITNFITKNTHYIIGSLIILLLLYIRKKRGKIYHAHKK